MNLLGKFILGKLTEDTMRATFEKIVLEKWVITDMGRDNCYFPHVFSAHKLLAHQNESLAN